MINKTLAGIAALVLMALIVFMGINIFRPESRAFRVLGIKQIGDYLPAFGHYISPFRRVKSGVFERCFFEGNSEAKASLIIKRTLIQGTHADSKISLDQKDRTVFLSAEWFLSLSKKEKDLARIYLLLLGLGLNRANQFSKYEGLRNHLVAEIPQLEQCEGEFNKLVFEGTKEAILYCFPDWPPNAVRPQASILRTVIFDSGWRNRDDTNNRFGQIVDEYIRNLNIRIQETIRKKFEDKFLEDVFYQGYAEYLKFYS